MLSWWSTVGSSVESTVPTGSWTRDLWCANPVRYPLAHSDFLMQVGTMWSNHALFRGMIKLNQTFGSKFKQANLIIMIKLCFLYALCTKKYVQIPLILAYQTFKSFFCIHFINKIFILLNNEFTDGFSVGWPIYVTILIIYGKCPNFNKTTMTSGGDLLSLVNRHTDRMTFRRIHERKRSSQFLSACEPTFSRFMKKLLVLKV